MMALALRTARNTLSRGRPRRGLRRLAVRLGTTSAAGVALLLAAGSLDAQLPPAGPELVEVRFDGAASFGSRELRSAIVSRATSCRTPALLPACWFGVGVDHRFVDENTLRDDLLRLRLFYYERGYRNALVELERSVVASRYRGGEEEGVRVSFRIHEGRPVRVASIQVVGAEDLLEASITDELPVKRGQPLDIHAYEASRDSLTEMLRNAGHARAEVLAAYEIPAGSELADVRFEVVAGPRARFGAIQVSGNDRVSDGVVRRMLTFREGDIYRHAELLRSQQNLFGLAIFRHAEIRTDLDAEPDTVVPIHVQVSEGDVHRVRVGTGVSSADCISAEGRWTSRNFLGGARRLELRGEISNVFADQVGGAFPCFDTGRGIYSDLTGSVGADFAQPWFFSPLNTFRARLFLERRSLPDVFVRSALGAELSLERLVGRRTSVSFGYRPELTQLAAEGDLFFCVNFVACEARDIQLLADPHWLAPLTIGFARDRSTSPFDPTGGYMLQVQAELASSATGSDFEYTRIAADLTVYRELVPGTVLAGRIRPGWALARGEPEAGEGLGLHPQRRFFAGGPNSVRGFAQQRLGPKVLTVDAAGRLAAPPPDGAGCTALEINAGVCDANPIPGGRLERGVRPVGGNRLLEGSVELRFPLTAERLRGAAFVDFGQVWSTGVTPASALLDDGDTAERVRPSLADLAWTPGFGVRYLTAIGPIRVDLGYTPRTTEQLTVITTRVREEDGTLVNTAELRRLDTPYVWRPRGTLFDRLQLHISIGQAY